MATHIVDTSNCDAIDTNETILSMCELRGIDLAEQDNAEGSVTVFGIIFKDGCKCCFVRGIQTTKI